MCLFHKGVRRGEGEPADFKDAGVSYEFIMLTGKSDSKLAYYLSVPGMWVQRLTTREPDLEMCEVAIKSVEAVLDWRAYEEAMHKGELE